MSAEPFGSPTTDNQFLNRLFRVETNGENTVLRYVRVEFLTETRHVLSFTRNSNGQQAQRRCPLTTVKPPRCFGLPFVFSHYFLSPSLCMHLSDGSRSDTSRDHPFDKHPRTPTMPPWGCATHLCPCYIRVNVVSTFLNALTQGTLA
jgi:hypothetical protein